MYNKLMGLAVQVMEGDCLLDDLEVIEQIETAYEEGTITGAEYDILHAQF